MRKGWILAHLCMLINASIFSPKLSSAAGNYICGGEGISAWQSMAKYSFTTCFFSLVFNTDCVLLSTEKHLKKNLLNNNV